jgi:hypothetical protein
VVLSDVHRTAPHTSWVEVIFPLLPAAVVSRRIGTFAFDGGHMVSDVERTFRSHERRRLDLLTVARQYLLAGAANLRPVRL